MKKQNNCCNDNASVKEIATILHTRQDIKVLMQMYIELNKSNKKLFEKIVNCILKSQEKK